MRGLNRVAVVLSSAALLAAEPLRLAAQVGLSGGGSPTTQPAAAAAAPAAPTTQPAATQSSGSFVPGVPTLVNPGDGRRFPTTQIAFNFKDASIDAILDYLSQQAGFIVIKDSQISGRVSVESKTPVTPDEAVTLLQSVLKTTGFTIIQMDRVLKVTTFDKAKKQNIPVQFGADPTKVPNTDQLVTWVIPVKSVDAVKLKQDLQPLVGPDADLSSNGGSNSIIMTDTAANIHRVVQIIANLDTKSASENNIIIKHMQYADAAAAAKLITDLFKTDQANAANQNGFQGPGAFFRALGGGGGGGGFGGGGFGGGRFGGGGGGGGRGGFGGGGGPGGGGAQQEEGNLGKVLASSDQRTNTVVVTGPSDTLEIIGKVLDEIDKPASEEAFFIYPVRNGTAVDMAATLNAMFTGTGSTGGTSGANTSNRLSSGSSGGRSGSSGFGGSSGGFGGSSGGFGGSSGGSSGFGGGSNINRNSVIGGTGGSGGGAGGGLASAVRGGASGSGGPTSPLADLLGQVYVVADQDTNSLLIATATKYQDKVLDVLRQLDRPVPQVLVKVLIAEVTHDNSLDVGADWSILNINSRNGGKAGLTLSANNGNATATGGLTVALVEDNLTATLHALATAGKVDVLSRPYILTSDNQAAEIVIGSEVPIITNSQLTDTGQQINTVQYRDIGIILDVTPHINPEGLVICDVSPEVSATTDQSVPIASNVNAPVFSLRSANTRVGIKDGQTIVIGGLMQDQKTSTVSKIPILGDLPLVGPVFSRTQVSKTKTELLFFITPHVAQVPERLQQMSQDEMTGVRLTPRAVQPGVYGDQMRGMNLGGSSTQPAPLLAPAGAGPSGVAPVPGINGGATPATPPRTWFPAPDPSSPPRSTP